MTTAEPIEREMASRRAIVEALIFAADEPLPADRIAGIVEEMTPALVDDIVAELNAGYLREGRAFRIVSVAGGFRMLTRPEHALWIKLLHRSSRPRLSQAALETLSIIAYRQPVARTELEGIRGVNVDGVLKTLVERDLVRIAGRGEGLGRPLLYATTERFLEYFGLPDLEALPRPEEVELAPPDEPPQEELFDGEAGAGGPEP
ncbi:MAG TPA: SMC-Scp complex subunit ScpB [Gemmatimonadota bacterium]|nr:SMC-Scp complex subunit ScpB [Gemmatimonadota bacterium]